MTRLKLPRGALLSCLRKPALCQARHLSDHGSVGKRIQEDRFGAKVGSSRSHASASDAAAATSLLSFIEERENIVVISGAGISTESDIPDYRGPKGAYTTGFKPVMHQKFVSCEKTRRRYWGRSQLGWPKFSLCRPNAGHFGLARLEAIGRVKAIVTQNVDRLHQAAGSREVLELHGTTHTVGCLSCDYQACRESFQRTLDALNPGPGNVGDGGKVDEVARHTTPEGTPGLQRPDGDVEAEIGAGYVVPACPRCGGILKPDVTFFGDNVPRWRVDAANDLVASSDGVLVVGSSLMTFSAFRLAKLAEKEGKKIAVLNMGHTRIDGMASVVVKCEAPIGQAMSQIIKCGNF
mmetsp:Transcript_27354/g.57954  ORF Transcript_27354/g.57954 Transcript_27354/m.57954 type:complete len:350 (-) Transcript_27354:89-1138(-)